MLSWLEIEICIDILFFSGVVCIVLQVQSVFDSLVGILVLFFNLFWIEGYIDNKLINMVVYLFNWELLVVCVVSVVWLFFDYGVMLGWFGIMGWGEVCFIVDNIIEDGCNCNCCVLVVVLSDCDGFSCFIMDVGKQVIVDVVVLVMFLVVIVQYVVVIIVVVMFVVVVFVLFYFIVKYNVIVFYFFSKDFLCLSYWYQFKVIIFVNVIQYLVGFVYNS